MTPEYFWDSVELIQKDLRFVQFEIMSLWELLYNQEYVEYEEIIHQKIKEKNAKEWRFICQLQYLQDNMANPNL